jgi:hypothetical protein
MCKKWSFALAAFLLISSNGRLQAKQGEETNDDGSPAEEGGTRPEPQRENAPPEISSDRIPFGVPRRDLAVPRRPASVCDAKLQPAPHFGVKNGLCLPSCGATGGTASFRDACTKHGLVTAGLAYDVPFCCKKAGAGPVVTAPVPPPAPAVNRGIVHANGRNFEDDRGAFYPLGATLFWGLHGWKFDKERVKKNLDYLKAQKYDYVRILGEVDWGPDNSIDPAWLDYQTALAQFMDYAYDVCGLRVEITIIGGGHDDQAYALAQRIAEVVKDGRAHKVLDFEVANEGYQRRISLDEMRRVGGYLRQQFPSHLVALTSGEGTPIDQFTDVMMRPASANLGTIHMDRTFGDGGWRAVRQSWDWKDRPYPVSHNEPIGPRSSVKEEMDPVRLAMLRAVGIINGVHAFVLHNGAGVAGQVDPGHNRPANLWEVPGIDDIMAAVRGVDKFLPPGTGNGQHWNNGWAGNPFNVDSFWGDGADHGVNRNYTVATPDGWVSSAAGVKNYAVYTATKRSMVEVFDVLKGKVKEVELEAGEKFRLEPVSRDSNGYGAFLLVGHYR